MFISFQNFFWKKILFDKFSGFKVLGGFPFNYHSAVTV